MQIHIDRHFRCRENAVDPLSGVYDPKGISGVMGYTIHLEQEANAENDLILAGGLDAYNTPFAGSSNQRALSALLRDDAGDVVGGVSGVSKWDWLHIRIVWVSEELRGQGFGSALMVATEREAQARGCTKAYLDTYSFQARGFYERLGYQVFGELADFPPGHTRYFLHKRGLTNG